ncbi:MAG: SDR family NAD(P)-dependent oxidoreductase [Candidatus Aureabacteria bacterium]|nr:SDR family NAD(P)-dependent oxidoreductase [Candidatus Auribacterota bacterium]
MNILVTGGAGFIGSFIVDRLLRDGHRVRIFDNLDPQVHREGKRPDYLNPRAEFIQGDVRDYDALRAAMEGMDLISHHAAAVGVGQSQYQVKHYTDVNIGGTANLLDILANHPHKVKKLVVAASMSSYGEGTYDCRSCGRVRPPLRTEEQFRRSEWECRCPKCGVVLTPVPIREEDERMSTSIYAITKMVQEEMCLNIGITYRIPTVAMRYFNVYGPRQSLSNPYTGVGAIFMSRIKNGKPPVIFEDGLQSRDFVSVHDIVEANMLAMTKPEADYRMYNVASGKVTTVLEIAETISDLCGKKIRPEITMKFRKGDVRHCIADAGKIKKELGFKARVDFREGMRELIQWSEKAEAIDLVEKATAELKARGIVEA